MQASSEAIFGDTTGLTSRRRASTHSFGVYGGIAGYFYVEEKETLVR